MDFETQVKLAVYQHFVQTGTRPSPAGLAKKIGSTEAEVARAYQDLASQRLLVLEGDSSIRMAPPFSGVRTSHVVLVEDRLYYANCAWDALGIIAALHQPGEVQSRCGQSGEPLRLEVGSEGPRPSSWLFHSLVPAAGWWDDIVFT